MALTRKQVIQRLVMMKSYAIGEDYEALEYAISSLKTDEMYQLVYEGGEIFTKDEVVAMLTEIMEEATKERFRKQNISYETEFGYLDYEKIIQQKINALKEQEDGKNDI